MGLFKKKKVQIPVAETQSMEAVELWYVRWRSRYGEYSGDTKDECEILLSEEDAIAYQKALKDAFKMIRHTHGTGVTIEKETKQVKK